MISPPQKEAHVAPADLTKQKHKFTNWLSTEQGLLLMQTFRRRFTKLCHRSTPSFSAVEFDDVTRDHVINHAVARDYRVTDHAGDICISVRLLAVSCDQQVVSHQCYKLVT